MESLLSNTCSDSVNSFLGLFDFSIAPTLLYYAYIPVVIASILLALFILIKDKFSLSSKLLMGIALFFSLWVLNIILEWIAVPNPVIHFGWQLTALLEIPIFLLAVYFIDVFLNQKDISFNKKLLLSAFYIIPVVLTSTKFNISSYDVTQCQGILGSLWYYVYGLEIFCIAWVGYVGKRLYVKQKNDISIRKKTLLVTIAMVIFLAIFAGSNIYGELLQNYEINLVGPIGMALFLGFISYIVVKYKSFNVHLIGAQVLVYALWAVVFSLLFINNIKVTHYIVFVTFLILLGFGVLLIKSIAREVSQRERLEMLTKELEVANEKLKGLDKLKTEFLSLASHQLRTPLTAIKGYASMLFEGSFGKLESKQDDAVKRIYTSAQGLVNVVEDLLNVSKIEQGGMKYEFSPTDLSALVTQLYGEMTVPAQSKKLEFILEMDKHDKFIVNADPVKLKQVFLNLTDNSIKYTQKGFVKISLKRSGSSIVFTVSDNGMGISPETKAKLFEKFSRGEGGKTNTGGSGLGLYLAQQIARAHKGDVTIESEGLGKGSQFIVTLPASGNYPN